MYTWHMSSSVIRQKIRCMWCKIAQKYEKSTHSTKFWCSFPLESFQWQANSMDQNLNLSRYNLWGKFILMTYKCVNDFIRLLKINLYHWYTLVKLQQDVKLISKMWHKWEHVCKLANWNIHSVFCPCSFQNNFAPHMGPWVCLCRCG